MSDPFVPSSSIRSGVVMTAQDRASVISTAQHIENAGFDSIWVGDHISFYVPIWSR